MKKVIQSNAAPNPLGPYSQAIEANGFVFLSGQIPIDPATNAVVTGDIVKETERVMENLKAVLQAAHIDFVNVVKTNIFLTDLNDFNKVNEVYGRYFREQPPARSTVQVAALPKGVRIEIEMIASRA